MKVHGQWYIQVQKSRGGVLETNSSFMKFSLRHILIITLKAP